jgi:hypothetical protein
MYERMAIQPLSIWKPGHIAMLAGSAALIAVVLIVKARKGKKKRRK